MNRKKILLILVIAVVIVATVVAAGIYRNRTVSSPDTDTYVPSVAPKISGKTACLPLKSDTPEVTEGSCQLGIKNSKGLYLELRNMPQGQLKEGEKIEVKGTFNAPDPKSQYQTSGTIDVEQ